MLRKFQQSAVWIFEFVNKYSVVILISFRPFFFEWVYFFHFGSIYARVADFDGRKKLQKNCNQLQNILPFFHFFEVLMFPDFPLVKVVLSCNFMAFFFCNKKLPLVQIALISVWIFKGIENRLKRRNAKK